MKGEGFMEQGLESKMAPFANSLRTGAGTVTRAGTARVGSIARNEFDTVRDIGVGSNVAKVGTSSGSGTVTGTEKLYFS